MADKMHYVNSTCETAGLARSSEDVALAGRIKKQAHS